MVEKNVLDWIALVLVIIGALNWGLFAFGINLVPILTFGVSILATIVYILVGLSGAYMIYYAMKK